MRACMGHHELPNLPIYQLRVLLGNPVTRALRNVKGEVGDVVLQSLVGCRAGVDVGVGIDDQSRHPHCQRRDLRRIVAACRSSLLGRPQAFAPVPTQHADQGARLAPTLGVGVEILLGQEGEVERGPQCG